MTGALTKRRSSVVTVTDQFCGAGGSSIGAEMVGLQLRLGMNHWKRAIETHSANFPHADHVCADISSTDPRRFPSTDILITSPECTEHSAAKTRRAVANLFSPFGADEAERSRATMMDVPRFAEHHGYDVVVVENVVEVTRWAGFNPWLQYMHNLDYRWRLLSVNSFTAHPTPQSRDRLYVVFWKRGNRAPELEFRPPSWCPRCEALVEGVQSWRRAGTRCGKYRQQYDFACGSCSSIAHPLAYPAAAAIDWTLPTPLIGGRARPLAEATRRRVEVGLRLFVLEPLSEAEAAERSQPGWLVATSRSNDPDGSRPRPTTDPAPTQTAQQEWALAVPRPFGAKNGCGEPMPFLSVLRSGRPRNIGTDEPLATVVSNGSGHALVQPFIAELRGGGSDVRRVDEPLATVTASGNHHALVTPPLAFYVKNFGRSEAAGPMAHDIREPLGTVTAVDHHSLVTMPFLAAYHGQATLRGVDEPMPTCDTRDRYGLVAPATSVDECGFRMLEPHEIGAAMAFSSTYQVHGNKRERVRQYGNAVTPPVMRMLLERCAETLQ